MRFVPRGTLRIEQHVTHAMSRGVSAGSRARCDALLEGVSPPPSPSAWTAYVVADAAMLEEGLTGTIKTGRPTRRVAVVVGGGFLALVLALAAFHRALRRRALEERDEAVLRAEVERMRVAASSRLP